MSDYILPEFKSDSHKGEQGKVLVVGGNYRYYGAPIFTSLAAEASGADLITVFLPQKHVETAKHYSLNLFLHQFVQSDFGLKDIGLIIDEATRHHVLIIGNGIGDDLDTKRAICKVLEEVEIPVVIDASALIPEILDVPNKKDWVITPHAGEFKRLFDLEANEKNAQQMAEKYGITILLKGSVDIIASGSGELLKNETGCPQMRVGGTGDALAGIVGSYISQGLSCFDAARSSSYYFGMVGEEAAKSGNITALRLIEEYGMQIA